MRRPPSDGGSSRSFIGFFFTDFAAAAPAAGTPRSPPDSFSCCCCSVPTSPSAPAAAAAAAAATATPATATAAAFVASPGEFSEHETGNPRSAPVPPELLPLELPVGGKPELPPPMTAGFGAAAVAAAAVAAKISDGSVEAFLAAAEFMAVPAAPCGGAFRRTYPFGASHGPRSLQNCFVGVL